MTHSTAVQQPIAAHWQVRGAIVALVACLAWSYWPTLAELSVFWSRNQDYSVGALVPFVALYLVWRQRQALARETIRPSSLGLLALVACEAMRQAAVYYGFGSGERYALVFSIAAAVWTAAGWRVLRRLFWVHVFLLLMVPLPARLHEMISLPLQDKATTSAVFLLELLGFYAKREGNVVSINDSAAVTVAEACSGLRMLTAFVFTSAVLAFLIDRPRWQKVVLMIFSIPVAVVSNSLRVVATSLVVYSTKDAGFVEQFHDLAGIAMMPLGIGMSILLLVFMRRLSLPDDADAKGAAQTGQRVAARHAVRASTGNVHR